MSREYGPLMGELSIDIQITLAVSRLGPMLTTIN